MLRVGSAGAKISVCMATRNGEQYLGEQLASILSQLGAEDEVIISDDSSTDRTVEIVRAVADRRIRLLADNRFFSPVGNFENALRHASGEIIVLSDQDDVWLDNKIGLIREQFRQARPAVHLVVLDGCAIDEAGRILEQSLFRRINAGPGLLKNIYDNTYMGCCMAFSRPLLDLALPFPRRLPMHDMWLGLLAELFGSVEFVPEQTIRYRKHAASLTGFSRRWLPWLQIRRRLALSWALGVRCLRYRRQWGTPR
ncbi:MAG: glycosyltransferase family 2 protein [Desulfuromonadales bacterium]|nr:glycosyltransferase family 2 protein [Desulfuromonadales bacterium]